MWCCWRLLYRLRALLEWSRGSRCGMSECGLVSASVPPRGCGALYHFPLSSMSIKSQNPHPCPCKERQGQGWGIRFIVAATNSLKRYLDARLVFSEALVFSASGQAAGVLETTSSCSESNVCAAASRSRLMGKLGGCVRQFNSSRRFRISIPYSSRAQY